MTAPDPAAILPPLTLTGVEVLTPDGLRRTDLGLAGGMIANGPLGRAVDLSGHLILPGIVDAHGDGFERHLAPRRGALADLSDGLAALDAELGACGITTAVLAQFWSWEGGMRGPDFARHLAAALRAYPARADMRMQLRLEIGCHAEFDAALALVEQAGIGQVVFNDHLPHGHLAQGRRPPRLEGQALKAGRSPEVHRALLQEMHDGMGVARARLPALIEALAARGVAIGSHDDDTPRARAEWRARGVPICEFPMSLETAEAAHEAGDPVIMGAPNLIRGGSHKGRGLSAREVLEAGHCDALASDYHYPAPFAAARMLVGEGWPVDRAWALVSSGPARVLGLTDRGRLAPGARADLIVTDPALSEVQATIAAGQVTWLAGPLAAHLVGR